MIIVLEPVYRENQISGLFAWCEGCDSRHYIPVIAMTLPDGQYQAKWEWNEDLVTPSITPSILVYEYAGHQPRCHSFIHEGAWEYLGDCMHRFANQRRPLLPRADWPEETWPNTTNAL